ncbi:uncharacterized protein A4U43_C02F22760 [Asparagus officinalis]|uniref:DUF834 domain-containing protein n=1 Tax=Asparagus officinalis TaxID=4686 RepID=A0A5P1FPB9_ASPOF|nr:uncharacterized protein A4U43_C02F22760 [Asparagus officinalis]
MKTQREQGGSSCTRRSRVHAKSLGVEEHVDDGRGHEADPPLQLLDLGDDEGLVGGGGGGDGEGPEEVGEEGGVEVVEPKEGDLKRGAPGEWGEELGGVMARSGHGSRPGKWESIVEVWEDKRSEDDIRAPPETMMGGCRRMGRGIAGGFGGGST